MNFLKNFNNKIYVIYNKNGEKNLITEEQYLQLLELKQKLEKLNVYDIEKYINEYNNSELPIKVVVFISNTEKRIILLYREEKDTLVDIIRGF